MRALKSIEFAVLFAVLVGTVYLWVGCGVEEVMDPSGGILGELSDTNTSYLIEEAVAGAPDSQGSKRSECVHEALEDYKECKRDCQDLKGKEKRDCIKDCNEDRKKAIEQCMHDQGASG